MTRELDEQVAHCAVCSRYQKSNQWEPLMPHEVPPRPWAKVGVDIFMYGGSDYVVIVDYFSKYPEVCHLEAKSAEAVIAHLKSTFARHGIPEVLIANNMPFGAGELRDFGRRDLQCPHPALFTPSRMDKASDLWAQLSS